MTFLTAANLFALCAQLLCLVATAGLVAALLRVDAAGVRFVYWRSVLALSLALPWTQGLASPAPEACVPNAHRIRQDAPMSPPIWRRKRVVEPAPNLVSVALCTWGSVPNPSAIIPDREGSLEVEDILGERIIQAYLGPFDAASPVITVAEPLE